MFDIDRMVEQRDSRYINGQAHMFATICDDWGDDVDDAPEIFTVGTYDVNGKPFTIDVSDEEFAEENASSEANGYPFKYVKVSLVRGRKMYWCGREITLEETRNRNVALG